MNKIDANPALQKLVEEEAFRSEQKADEFYKDYLNNTNGRGVYWQGRSDAYRYEASRLRVLLSKKQSD